MTTEAGGGAASFLDDIAVLVLTFDEAPNIARTLAALARFPEIVVLDSGSTDGTQAIVAAHPNARLVTRAFDEHAVQWNFGLAGCGIARPWVLSLDADYVLPPDLVEAIAALEPPPEVAGYAATFRYCVNGRPLRGTLYPERIVLFRRALGHYEQHGHTQRLALAGGVGRLATAIDHDDRKPLARWLESQQRYAAWEAAYLMSRKPEELRRADRVRLLGWPAPGLVFLYTLLAKGCLFDGWPGWIYVLQRTLAEIMIALEILDRRRGAKHGAESTHD